MPLGSVSKTGESHIIESLVLLGCVLADLAAHQFGPILADLLGVGCGGQCVEVVFRVVPQQFPGLRVVRQQRVRLAGGDHLSVHHDRAGRAPVGRLGFPDDVLAGLVIPLGYRCSPGKHAASVATPPDGPFGRGLEIRVAQGHVAPARRRVEGGEYTKAQQQGQGGTSRHGRLHSVWGIPSGGRSVNARADAAYSILKPQYCRKVSRGDRVCDMNWGHAPGIERHATRGETKLKPHLERSERWG